MSAWTPFIATCGYTYYYYYYYYYYYLIFNIIHILLYCALLLSLCIVCFRDF